MMLESVHVLLRKDLSPGDLSVTALYLSFLKVTPGSAKILDLEMLSPGKTNLVNGSGSFLNSYLACFKCCLHRGFACVHATHVLPTFLTAFSRERKMMGLVVSCRSRFHPPSFCGVWTPTLQTPHGSC